jgi:arylsulfate sulfotransferase
MKTMAPLKPCLLFAVVACCIFAVGCGGSSFNDPPGVGTTIVASTQNPLVAQYSVTTALGCPGQIAVEFGPDTSYGRTTAWYPVAQTRQSTTILVAGMKASTTYHMRTQAQCSNGTTSFTGADTTFKTGPLPSIAFPTLAVSRPDPSTTSPENSGIEEIDVTAEGTPAVFTDRDANPIWYYDLGSTNYPFTFKLLPNGHMILSVTSDTVFDSFLKEVDLSGNVIREMDISALAQKMQSAGFDFVPIALHHDLLPLPNGHLIVLTNFLRNFTDLPGLPGNSQALGDGVIDLDQNWNPVWAWNSFDYLDVNRHPSPLPDWTHGNALVYSAEDGNLLLSLRAQSWILKLDYNNGQGAGDIIWKLGYEGNFSLADADVPTDDPSVWFSFQHYPTILSQAGTETTLAVWDNGDNRVLDTNGTICGAPPLTACYSRATIFQIDESTMSANLVWDNLPGDYGLWGGNINQLGNGNVEFDINAPAVPLVPNGGSEVQEVTQASPSQIVWKMDVLNANAYRAYRVPSLYPGVSWTY